ncbi:MAG TPA: acetate/propionate family kinase [Roseiarcus sp.]|nr:acetate/propionate family kinase [Roseiarcus sp.]
MSELILTLNAGSSSVKFAAFAREAAGLEQLASGQIEGLGAAATFRAESASGAKSEYSFDESRGRVDHHVAVGAILGWLGEAHFDREIVAVGHRIVHGGPDFAEPARIDGALLARLRQLIALAPLHQPHNLAGVEAALAAFPAAPQVACFDTAFHRSHPFVADTFGLPRSYYEDGVRRYGFHGLSYEFIARRLRVVAPAAAAGRTIVAHLGNGASMCVMRDGRSVASTMGFTALDGLPMGTRCGQLDPGVVLYLMAEKRMGADAIADLLYKQSGLLGMSGLSQDMRVLEASDSPAARDAIAYFVARIRREIGGLAAAVEGVDAIVFTAGIGENSWRVREAALSGMEWLGVRLDPQANRSHAQVISAADSPIAVFVLQTNEERMIAEHTVETAGLAAQSR